MYDEQLENFLNDLSLVCKKHGLFVECYGEYADPSIITSEGLKISRYNHLSLNKTTFNYELR